MDKNFYVTSIILAMCGFVAYRIMKWLWPIIEQRKNLTVMQMVERAIMAPMEEQQRQATKFGSHRKTAVIYLVTFFLLIGWCRTILISTTLFWGLFAYLCIGFFIIRLVGVPKSSELVALGFSDRLWLRIFYAWLWPIYIVYFLRQK